MSSISVPPAGTMRWTAWQKAAVLRAVRNGMLSVSDVCGRYMLSAEEFAAWQAAFDQKGIAGLQLKSVQQRRRRSRRLPG